MKMLMVEDDKDLCDVIEYTLKQNGYKVDLCHNGEDAGFYINQNIYDVILLDRMLPSKDGMQILKEMRTLGNETPVIMVTAIGGIQDKIEGLDLGADDYLVKPYSAEELMARIRTILRRDKKININHDVSYSDLTLDKQNRTLKTKDKMCTLTPKEFELLEFFMKHAGRTLKREQLYALIWGDLSEVSDSNLDNYLYFLRKRLRNINSKVTISTVYAKGFCMEEKD